MSDDLLSRARQLQSAAPVGFAQQEEAQAAEIAAGNPDAPGLLDRARRWYTGGNMEGTANGYDTPFTRAFIEQQERAAANGTMASFFSQADATGIVTYDHGDGRFNFGDVYENGKLVGNVYEQYGEEKADLLLAPYMLDAKTQQQAYEKGTLRQEIQRARSKTEDEVAKFQGTQDYQAAVDAQQKAMTEDTLTDETAIGTAGLAGGAAVGAGIGTLIAPGVGTLVGGLIGGAIGGGAALLNQDDITEQAARAAVQQDMAHEEFGEKAGFFTGLKGWSSVAMRAFNPLSNTVRGLVDAQEQVGDGVSEWNRVDPITGERERDAWLTGVDIGLTTVDMLGQFANPLGQAAFTATMIGTIGGEVGGAFSTGGQAFNDRSGSFESFVTDDDGSIDFGSLAAGVGKVGIDVVQLGMGRGLIGKAAASTAQVGRATGTETGVGTVRGIVDKITGAAAGRSGTRVGGAKFTIDEATGAAVKARPTLSVLAPSEALQYITAQALARRAVERGAAVTADDFYRAANKLASGERAWTSALVNGFGEGGEELVQGILEPMMFDESAKPAELFEAFLYGGAAGVGMTLGSAGRGASAADRMYAQAYVVREALTGAKLSREEWDGMNPTQQRSATVAPKWLTEASKAAAKELQASQGRNWVATTAGIEKYAAAVQRVALQEQGKLTSRTDGAFVITQTADADVPNFAVVSSLETLRANLRAHLDGLVIQEGYVGPDAEAIAARSAAALAAGEQLITAIDEKAGEWRIAMRSNARQAARQAVIDVNSLISDWFNRIERDRNGNVLTTQHMPDEVLDARARAVSQTYVRDPQDSAGSYQILMPQADQQLTEARANNVLQISHAILKPLGGDYDGDKIRMQAQLILDDESFIAARTGTNFLGSNGKLGTDVNIDTFPYETWEIDELARHIHSGDTNLAAAANDAIKTIRDAIFDRYDGIIPDDQLIGAMNAFAADLRAGSDQARPTLLRTLASEHSNAISEFARIRRTNEWLWIDQIVQSNLQRFQRVAASHRPDEGRIDTSVASSTPEFDISYQVRRQQAATQGQTLGIMAEADSLFRAFQQLHYSSFNAAVSGANPAGNIELLATLTAFYEALGQGMTTTELDALDAKDELNAQVVYRLQRLAQFAAQATGVNANLSLVALASTRMFDVAADGTVYSGSTAQVLLRQAIAADKTDKAMVVTPQLEAKWARLTGLLSPDSAEEALVEVLGAMPLYQLVGEASGVLGGSITLEQAVRIVANQEEGAKQITKRELMAQPEYLGRKETTNQPYGLEEMERGEVTSYHAVADAIIGTAQKRISVDASGLAIGHLGDHEGGRSHSYHVALTDGFGAVREALLRYGGLRGRDLSQPAKIAEVFDELPDLAQSVLALIPDAAANAVFEVQGGVLHISSWVYEMLAMEPQKAAMHYWRNSLIARWNALGGRAVIDESGEGMARQFDNLTDRMHQLMYRIAKDDPTGIRTAKFMARLSQATDVRDFMRYVNTELRGNEAPYTAWINDVAEFSVDRAGGGLSAISDGTETREAMLSFRDRAKRLLRTVQDEVLVDVADNDTMADLEQAISLGTRAPDGSRRQLESLRLALQYASERLTALGPNAMKYEVAGSLMGFFAAGHTKGISPKPFVAPGAMEAVGNAFGYSSGFEQHQAALHSQDVVDVASNMSLLARGRVRVMDEAGRTIDWSQLTPETFVRLWRHHPESHAALRAIVSPSVWERTLGDGIALQSAVGKSLTDLLKKNPTKLLFAKTHEATMLYTSQIDSLSAKYGSDFSLLRVVNDLAIARTSHLDKTIAEVEVEKFTDEAFRDVVSVLQAVGELAANNSTTTGANGEFVSALEALKVKLREEQRSASIAKLLRITDRKDRAFAGQLLDEAKEAFRADVLASVDPNDPDSARRAKAEIMAVERRLEYLTAANPFEAVMAAFAIPADPAGALAKKVELTQYIRTHQSLQTKAAWAKTEIQMLLQRSSDPKALREDNSDVVRLAVSDRQNDEMWETLSRAVVATYLDDLASFSSDNVSVPVFPTADKEAQLKYWDPTWTYLVDSLLDVNGPVVQAAVTLHRQAGRGRALQMSDTKLTQLIQRTVLDTQRLGPWSSDIVRASVEAGSRLSAAAAGDAIAMSGLAVVRQAIISAVTRRTDKAPAPNTTSKVTLTLDELRGRPDTIIRTGVAQANGDVRADVPMPLAMLNGRFAGNVIASYADPATGQTVTLDSMWNARYPEIGRLYAQIPSVLRSGFRAITVQGLRRALETVLPDGVDPASVFVTVDYLHPESQPATADYFNNVYYEGLTFELDADQQEALNSTLYFTTGGISPTGQTTALQSNKKSTQALRVTPVPAASDPTGFATLEQGWQDNLAAVLWRKALVPLTTDTGNGVLKPAYFNALFKGEKLRHFVRGFTPGTTDPVLWTAEQVLQFQAENPGVTLPLERAELWVPSERVLRTLLGEQGEQGVPRPQDAAPVLDLSRMPAWQGVTEVVLARVPGVLEVDPQTGTFKKGVLWETMAGALTFQSQLRIAPPLDSKTRSAYEQAIVIADGRRAAIYAARQQQQGRAGITPGTFNAKIADFRGAANSLDLRALGMPMFPSRTAVDSKLSGHLLQEIRSLLTLSSFQAAWIYREGPQDKRNTPTTGVLSQVNIEEERDDYKPLPLHQSIAPDDVVIVDLEALEEYTTDAKRVEISQRRMRRLMGRRAIIVLPDAETGGDLRDELGRYLLESGYESVAGSRHIFQPRQMNELYQNQRAHVSTLTEVRTITGESHLVNFLVRSKYIAENAALLVKRDRPRNIAQTVNLMPVNFLGRFNVPRDPAQVAIVRQALSAIANSPEARTHLHTVGQMDGNQAADFDRAFDRMIENWGDASLLPRLGTPFGTGDIIPLVGPGNQVVLYRHGHKAPSLQEIRDQLATPYDATDGPTNIAVFSPKLNADHTTHTGTLRQIRLHSKYGLMAKIDVELQAFGDKIQLEGNGMKYVLTTWSRKMLQLPKHSIFRHWGIDIVSSLDDVLAKEAYGGIVDNFRNAFAYFGVDFTPELVEGLFGVQYETLSAQEQAVQRTNLNNVLQWFATNLPKHDPIVIADLLRSTQLEKLLAEEVAIIGAAPLQDFGLATSGWLAQVFADNPSPASEITKAVLLYLMVPTAKPEHVVGANGFSVDVDMRTSEHTTHFMPPLFTNYLDNAQLDSPLRIRLFEKLNARIHNPVATSGRQTGYTLTQDWRFLVRNGRRQDDVEGRLQFSEAHPSGDNPVLNGMAAGRAAQSGANVSVHGIGISAMALGGVTAIPKTLAKTERFASGYGVERFEDDNAMWRLFHSLPPEDKTYLPWQQLNPAEIYRKQLAREAVGGYRKPIDTADWTDEERQSYDQLAKDVVLAYGLQANQAGLVDGWIRQQLGQPLGEGFEGKIGAAAAVEMATEIRTLAAEGHLPTHGGEVAQLHYFDLSMMHRAYEKGGRFSLLADEQTGDKAVSLDDWVKVALAIGETEHEFFDPMYLLEADGFMHTYQDAGQGLLGLPVSRSILKAQELWDPETLRMVISLDPNEEIILQEGQLLSTEADTLAEIMGGQRINGRYRAHYAPSTSRAKRRAAQRKWRKERDMAMPVAQTMKSYRERGAQFIDEGTTSNALLRILVNMRVGTALLNPLLFVSAGPEKMIRGALEDATNLLTGDSTGVAGTALAAVGAGRYTPEQLKQMRQLRYTLGKRKEFLGMIYRDLNYQQPRLSNAGRIERWTANYARWGSRVQDPSWGTRGDTLARRYLEGVLREMAANPGDNIESPEYVMARLSRDPEWVAKNKPEWHAAATATIASVSSLKPVWSALVTRAIYEPLSENPNLIVSVPSTLFLKLPLLFSTYAMNVATNMLGLQGLQSAMAMLVDGRSKGIVGRAQALMAGKPYNEEEHGVYDMSSALEGIDLAKTFVQAGITHTNLFALGLLAGGLNLSGEDDEDRRIRRAAAYQGAGYVYDPRAIENDFRNADAVFLDWLPFGLDSFFRVTSEDSPSGQKSMADLHWILRQFISPIIGMEKYFETGDSRQLVWGFQDALNSFPLINPESWDDAVSSFAELDKAAKDAENRGTPAELVNSYGYMVNAVASLERMLLENSFVNAIYTAKDKYDRDPFVLPARDGQGNILRDKLNVPQPTDALESYIADDGTVREGYVGRDFMDAQLHGLTENRATLALFMSLFNGQLDSDYLRENMVAKTRTIERPELSMAEAEGLVLSAFDQAGGHERLHEYDENGYAMSKFDDAKGYEILTEAGARAVFDGVWHKSVELGSPALEGLFIPFEMREQIQAKWMAELVQEGLDRGLDEKQAKFRMNEIWYGPKTDANAIGLKDILWSQDINYARDMRYYQLNTTYVMGPDGRPWATGVSRDVLSSAFGIPPLQRYIGDEKGLPKDGRLNSVDEAADLNTGLRALEKADESWIIPTDEQIGESIEKAITKAMADSYQPSTSGWQDFGNGWQNFGRRGGGGGGGGGSFTRLNAPQDSNTPYVGDIPFINTSNPIIRRASVRRERISSDRGRLNPWQ